MVEKWEHKNRFQKLVQQELRFKFREHQVVDSYRMWLNSDLRIRNEHGKSLNNEREGYTVGLLDTGWIQA